MGQRYIPISFENPKKATITESKDRLEVIFEPDRDNAQNIQTLALAAFSAIWICIIVYLVANDSKTLITSARALPVQIFLLTILGVVYFGFVGNHLLAYLFGKKVIAVNKNSLAIIEQKGLLNRSRVFEKDGADNFDISENTDNNAFDLMGCIGSLFCKFNKIDFMEKKYALSFAYGIEKINIAASDNREDLIHIREALDKTGFFTSEKFVSDMKNSDKNDKEIIQAPRDMV
jgi:hypothetical protein